jgi:hypothetical protein
MNSKSSIWNKEKNGEVVDSNGIIHFDPVTLVKNFKFATGTVADKQE